MNIKNTDYKTIKGNEYIKVGRITMSVARKSHIKAANIMIDMNHIKHIAQKHELELSKLGISSIDFVKCIASSYTEIRVLGNSLYLVAPNDSKQTFVAIVKMNYNIGKGFWEVKTAIPMRIAEVLKKELIWKKGANPLK